LEFCFWVAVGDDFHVTKWMFADLPLDLGRLAKDERKQLLSLVPKLKRAADEAVQFKLNAGKKVGNYNMAKCREVTDRADMILARAYGFEQAWNDVELLYVQIVKTNFDVESDDQE